MRLLFQLFCSICSSLVVELSFFSLHFSICFLFFGEEIVGHQFLLHFQGMLVHVHQRGFSQEKLVSPVI